MLEAIYHIKTLKIDELAESRNIYKQASILKPGSSPVYHGFPLVPETETEGFIFGAISDFLDFDSEDGCTYGDGYIQAPDGSRAGLIWKLSEQVFILETLPPEAGRWGVYHVGFEKPIKSLDDLVYNFKQLLPMFKEIYKRTLKSI